MWYKLSHILHPLTVITLPKVKFKCTDVEQKAFDKIKCTVARDTLLAYPDLNKCFNIYTGASDHQLGAVIRQEGKPIALYSLKITETKKHYTVTEKELMSIVETLRKFRTILLGQQLKIYTDHKNLTYKKFNTDRVLCWILILEEYSPEI